VKGIMLANQAFIHWVGTQWH